MTRQAIFGGWSLELPSGFDRRETDDGFVIFRRDGHTVRATIYEVDAASSDGALLEVLDGFFDCSPEPPFEELVPHVVGYTIDGQDNLTEGIYGLSALAAIPGRVALIDFEFERREERALAIEIWRSCRIEQGTPIADAALNKLWWAIQSGGGTQQAIETLRDQGRGDEALLLLRSALADPEPTTRANACLALEDLDDPAATDDLKPMLDDEDAMVVVRAADALVRLGEPATTLIPYLIEILRRPEESLPLGRGRITSPCAFLQLPEARCHAARILGEFGVEAAPARTELVSALKSQSGTVRAEAAIALAGIGESKETFLPSLRKALDDDAFQSPRERVSVAEALIQLGEPPASVISAMAALVEDQDWTTACWAMRLLGDLGGRARDAVPALIAAQNCGRQDIANEATNTLARIVPSSSE